MLPGVPKLPLKPPIKPQLARSAKALPEGEEWRYEPKWDGFRTLAFKNGDDVYLQSRGGKPMNRYFPDVVKLVEAMPADEVVLDGEMVIEVDGVQEFDLLSQRIHPAESRVTMLAEKYPAAYIAFDLLADGGKSLMDLGYEERRERLGELDLKPVQVTDGQDHQGRAEVAHRATPRAWWPSRPRRSTCPASARAW